MKKSSFLSNVALGLIAAALFTSASCTKLAKNLQYDLDMQTATVDIVIPPTPDTTVALLGTQTSDYNIDSFIKANTANVLGVGNITSATLRSCTLAITPTLTTTANNFQNFKSINASFFTDGNKTPYTLRVLNNPNIYAETLTLPVDQKTELKGYLSGGNKFTYSVNGMLRKAITDTVRLKATIVFSIHVQG